MIDCVVDVRDSNGQTPLHTAAVAGAISCVQTMCTDKRIDVDIKNYRVCCEDNNNDDNDGDRVRHRYILHLQQDIQHV